MAPIALTPIQQQIAVSLGIDTTNVTAADLSKIKDAEALQTGLSNTKNMASSNQADSLSTILSGTQTAAPADGFVRTTPKVETKTVETETGYRRETSVRSSDEFYQSQIGLIDDMTELGRKAAAEYQKTGDRKAADRLFYDSETQRLKTAIPPEVTKEVVQAEMDYKNSLDPTSAQNEDDCTLGVLKQSQSDVIDYLVNSRDPRLSELAKKSQDGDLASTYALIGIVDSWQEDMLKNANEGKLTADTANNVGGQPLKTDTTWNVPAEFVSIEDYEKIKGKDQEETPADPVYTKDTPTPVYTGKAPIKYSNREGGQSFLITGKGLSEAEIKALSESDGVIRLDQVAKRDTDKDGFVEIDTDGDGIADEKFGYQNLLNRLQDPRRDYYKIGVNINPNERILLDE